MALDITPFEIYLLSISGRLVFFMRAKQLAKQNFSEKLIKIDSAYMISLSSNFWKPVISQVANKTHRSKFSADSNRMKINIFFN